MTGRSYRVVAVVATLGMLVGAIAAAPAEAKKKKRCRAYSSAGVGKDAELSVVTDKATAKKPLEVMLPTEPGFGFSSPDPESGQGPVSYAYQNVQVDSKKASAKLFVRVEFLQLWDYDLYLRPDGGVASHWAAGFNQAPFVPGVTDGTGNGGHSEIGAEEIHGADSLDCTGYTVDVTSATTTGGDVTLKLWLGK
ncbi:MAG: hypothetical protein ACRDJJ_06385 [Actinomycetota bacterium]